MVTETFQRTRRTWQAYSTIAYYSYLLNALGPLTPFLRAEMNLTYTVASFHFSAYALGVVVTGLLLHRAVRRYGARAMVWTGVFGIALGTLLLMVGRAPAVTVAGAFLMGLLGVMISALLSTALAEQHGAQRAVALAEASMLASLLSTLAPAAVGFFGRTALTWRAALGLMLLAAPVLWLVYRRDPLEAATGAGARAEPLAAQNASRGAPLPFAYWVWWLVLLLAEAVEFCMIFWAADYLEKAAGFSRAGAAAGVSVFLGSMLVGRALVSRLLRRSKEQPLLVASMLVGIAGFVLFWRAPAAWAALVGLAIAGLGVAGQFPMINALALAAVPGRMVEGSSKILLAVGLALFALPLALGWLADQVGIREAFALELVLMLLGLALTLAAGRRGSLTGQRILHGA
jgi:fucose permease